MTEGTSLRVDLIPRAGGYKDSTDISAWVLGVPRFTDTGLDQVNSAVLVLDSPEGEFLVRTGGDAPPIIRHNDHFRIRCRAENGTAYDREFEFAPVDGALAVEESAERGRIINLRVLGIEYHTQKIMYVGTHRWTGGRQVVRDIVDRYNESIGAEQPQMVIGDIGDVPSWTRNTYPYDTTPMSVHDRLRDVALSFGAPVDGGGILDFFTVGFETGGSTHNRILLNMRSLGYHYTRVGADDIYQVSQILVAENDEDRKKTGFSPARANRIVGHFDTTSGTLPTNASRFAGLVDRYNLLPVWQSDVEYPVGAEVRAPGTSPAERGPVYRARREGSGNPVSNGTFWETVSFAGFVGGIQYTPWTDDKHALWRNSGVAPNLTSYFGNSVPDFNIVIKDSTYWQVPVDVAASRSSEIPDYLLYPGRVPYRGLTVLVVGGRDDFEKFRNRIIMYEGKDIGWRVKYEGFEGGSRALEEATGIVWEWDQADHRLAWFPTADSDAYACLHPVDIMTNVDGIIRNLGNNNRRTAVAGSWTLAPITSRYKDGRILAELGTLATGLAGRVIAFLVSNIRNGETGATGVAELNPAWHKYGQSLRIKFPFPCNDSGGISEDVGQLYGGTGSNPEPATVDITNMTHTSSGRRGFNNDESEDLGRLGSVSFAIAINRYRMVDGRRVRIAAPNTRIRSSIRDMRDNLVVSDFVVPFDGKYEPITLGFAGYRPYLARAPKTRVDYIIPPREIEQANEFRWHEIRDFTWTIMTPYDDHGRFDPLGEGLETLADDSVNYFRDFGQAFVAHFTGSVVEMAIDNFHFNKQLIAVSPPDRSWNQERVIRVPDIFSYQSARNYVLSEQERTRFPKADFDLSVRGDFRLRYGEEFLYENNRVIPRQRGDFGFHNSYLLAAQHIEHSWLDSGLRTSILAGRRFRAGGT